MDFFSPYFYFMPPSLQKEREYGTIRRDLQKNINLLMDPFQAVAQSTLKNQG